jgi:16S rRNA (guanine527-N7)-methyltransferase
MLGSTDPGWIVEKLILDSLLFLRVLPPEAVTVADLGSGAGVPGIPIAIVKPEITVTLIESRRRRASFLSTAVRELPLPGARVVGRRAEEAPELGATFDAVVARCAARSEEVVTLAMTLLRPGGSAIISGPPSGRRSLAGGRWVEVPGIELGSTRRFAVIPKP